MGHVTHVTWSRPFHEWFVIRTLGLATIKLYPPNLKSQTPANMNISKAVQNVKNELVRGSNGSLKVTGNSTIRYSAYDIQLAFHSNYRVYLYLASFLRYIEILVENDPF